MSKWLALLIACLALGLVVAGCGDDDDDDGGGAAETTEQPAETRRPKRPAAARRERQRRVGMKDIQFDPDSVTVKVGGTVKWTNNESVPHDVTKEDGPGPEFASGKGNMKEGDTFEQTFEAAGTVNYVCTVHPNMKGTVKVQ